MSEEHVELARRGMEGMEAFFGLLDERVVFDYRAYRLPDQPEIDVGRDKVIEMFRRYWGTFTDYSIGADEYIDAGASVVLDIVERGRGKGSGVPFERRWAQIWTFRRGRIMFLETFPSKEAALEALGFAGSDARG